MSETRELLLAALRERAGTWIDAMTLSREVRQPINRVVHVLEEARKTGAYHVSSVKRGNSFAFMVEREKQPLSRAPIYATAPEPSAPTPTPTRKPDAPNPPPPQQKKDEQLVMKHPAVTFDVNGDFPIRTHGGVDYVAVIDIAGGPGVSSKLRENREAHRLYDVLRSRALGRKLAVKIENPYQNSGLPGQRAHVYAVRRSDLKRLAAPVEPSTQRRPIRVKVIPADPKPVPVPPTPAEKSDIAYAVDKAAASFALKPDTMKRLVRVSLTSGSTVSEIVELAVDQWLKEVGA